MSPTSSPPSMASRRLDISSLLCNDDLPEPIILAPHLRNKSSAAPSYARPAPSPSTSTSSMSPHHFQPSHPIRHPTPPSNPYPQPPTPHLPVPGPTRLFNGLDALVHAATEERRRLSGGNIATESPLPSRASPVEPSSPAHQFHPSRHDRHRVSDDHGHSPSQQLPIARHSPITSSLHTILSPAPPTQSPIYPSLQHRQHASHEGSNTHLSPIDDSPYRSSQAVLPSPREIQSPRHHPEQGKHMQHIELQRQRQHHDQLLRQEQHQFIRERHNQIEALVTQGPSVPSPLEGTSQPRPLPSPSPIIYSGGRRSDPGLLHGSLPFVQPGLRSYPNTPATSQLYVDHITSHPDKKRRYSDSPSYISSGGDDRLHYEREKMASGDLGYGRPDTAPSTSSFTPRPPSNHGNGRKHLALVELIATNREREWSNSTNTSPAVEPMHDGRGLGSPLGRRSPPGSQIGRARAARKSDEPYPDRQQPVMENGLPSENEDKKSSSPPVNPQVHPPPSEDSRLVLKHSPPLAHSPLPSRPQEEDPHEWFLEHFDEYSGSRPRQPTQHSPSSLPNPIAPSKSPVPKKKMLPPITMPEAAVALERELEELVVTKPTKVEQEIDIDMEVDLAVSELVAETLEVHNPKAEDVVMEVDVEDELLSLVDDRPVDRRSSYHASLPSKHLPSLQPSDESKIVGPCSPSVTAPFVPSPSVSRQPSNRPPSDRGSMPPPPVMALSKSKDKDGKRGERAGSVTAPAPAQKKGKVVGHVNVRSSHYLWTLVPQPAAKSKATNASLTIATKSRTKGGPKSKPKAADGNTTPAASKSTASSGPSKKPLAFRSRSTSVMPVGSVGPEGSDMKPEKQEEEEASEEDDKLYCICKMKYDEDKFMIACDR